MKKHIIAQIVAIAVTFLSAAFIKASFDVAQWGEGARLFAVVSWLGLAGIFALMIEVPK